MATQTRTQRIQDVLRALKTSCPDVTGAVLVSADGFIVAAALDADVDAEGLSGVGSALMTAGARLPEAITGAAPEQVFVRSGKGCIIASRVPPDALLVVLVAADARLGRVMLEMRRRAGELAEDK